MSATHSTFLSFGIGKDGAPNAIFDPLSRVVCSFPTDRTHDTRRGSPSTPETILANARLFAAAPALLDALELTRGNVASLYDSHPRIWGEWLAVIDAAIAAAKGGPR